MAVVRVNEEKKLVIKVETGVTPAGFPKYSVRNFPHINHRADDADLLSVGTKLAALTPYPLGAVGGTDGYELTEIF